MTNEKRNCNDPPSSPLINDFNLVEVTQDPSLRPAQTPHVVDHAAGTVTDRLPHPLGHQDSQRCPSCCNRAGSDLAGTAKIEPFESFLCWGMETGTIVEYKACKRNSVANLELKAFAKAFPVSNMLVPQFLRKRIVLATTFQESSRAQARLTKRCRGYYSYHIPFLSLCPCKLCNVFHSVAGKASNGSFPRCSHLFKVCVCVCRIITRWMMCSFFAACYCTTLEPERLIETR